MQIDLEKIIQRAFWLNEQQRKAIADAMFRSSVKALSKQKQKKLAALLCCIPYAEEKLRFLGKRYLQKMEKILERLNLKKLICRSFGSWNFHVCHAERFGHTPEKFKALLEDDGKGIGIVVDFILEDIGLGKPADHIFAEYNHNIMATTVAALQKALNALMQKYNFAADLEEDGLIGEQTLAALKLSGKILKRPPLLNTLEEREIHRALDRIAEEEGIRVRPFIPQVQIRMDFSFIGKILSQSLRRPSQLKKLRLVFNNHINVPLYVNSGMVAYQHVLKET